MYDKSKMNGTAFQTRSQAADNFKTRYGSQYTNRFSKEPSSRPSYIPQSTSVGGRNYTIIYDIGHGGYGYYGPGGVWMMYDVMSDALMMNALMSHHGYYYGDAPPVHHSSWMALVWVLIMILALVLVVFVVAVFTRGLN